jgi:hypothetical protein
MDEERQLPASIRGNLANWDWRFDSRRCSIEAQFEALRQVMAQHLEMMLAAIRRIETKLTPPPG